MRCNLSLDSRHVTELPQPVRVRNCGARFGFLNTVMGDEWSSDVGARVRWVPPARSEFVG
jgi:hypothetical protein